MMINCVMSLVCGCFLSGWFMDSPEYKFTKAFEQGDWGLDDEGQPTSGWGSFYEFNAPYVQFLEFFFKEHHISSVVDAGCGDWASSKHVNWDGIQYLGLDVIPPLVKKNQAQFSNLHINFKQADILSDDLPPADLIICKDVLQHLTNQDILDFLKNIKGKYQHCLFTNDIVIDSITTVQDENQDIETRGPSRPIDLTKPPFNLPGNIIFTYPLRGDHLKQTIHLINW